ncbi:DUF761 domain-containing protein [Cinnamomum micranthum f. kanehirae]|uniref:DUF761 domain-containing protein n=1 Tax=Cinnamomum micranthum f. kanehirae TaxID=337451 RepID=A0A3S3QCB1_9MAGN|nr:DUF761 domain-containing protein [Cinnamomum micranthum f. kanehirae]
MSVKLGAMVDHEATCAFAFDNQPVIVMKRSSLSSLNNIFKSGEEAQRNHQMTLVREKKPDEVKKMQVQYDDINESAEAFIKRFRQHLQIQRLESIKNYEEMLARGL